jgi:hypothetical protein
VPPPASAFIPPARKAPAAMRAKLASWAVSMEGFVCLGLVQDCSVLRCYNRVKVINIALIIYFLYKISA